MSDHADPLEARYRRLLCVFPPGHRARYGEEMIDVLMASSAPEQRHPGFRESLDLVLSGLRTRLGAAAAGGLSPASRSAAMVFGFLSCVVLAMLSWYDVAADVVWRGVFDGPVRDGWLAAVPHRSLATGVGWTLVACLCAAGLRQLAALGAVVGFLGAVGIAGGAYGSAPDSLVSSWWLLTLTAFTAACLLALIRTAGTRGWRDLMRRDPGRLSPLGRRAVVALTATALLIVVDPVATRALTVVESDGDGVSTMHSRIPVLPLGPLTRDGDNHLGAVALVVMLVVLVLRLRPPVRRRVLLLTAPTVATAVFVQTGLRGYLESSARFRPPVYLTTGQSGALVLAPLLVFAIGTWLLRRYERRLAGVPIAGLK